MQEPFYLNFGAVSAEALTRACRFKVCTVIRGLFGYAARDSARKAELTVKLCRMYLPVSMHNQQSEISGYIGASRVSDIIIVRKTEFLPRS